MKHLKIPLLVLLLLWLLLSFLVGSQADRIHAQLGRGLRTNLPIAIKPLDFDRGLFSSRADNQVEIGNRHVPSWLAGTRLSLTHRIIHGPLPLAAWWSKGHMFQPAQAVIQTHITGNSTLVDNLGLLGQSLSQLEIQTWIALNAQTQIRATVPDDLNVQGKEEQLSIADMQLELSLHANGTPASLKFALRELLWCRQQHESICLRLSLYASGDGNTATAWSIRGDMAIHESLLMDRLVDSLLARNNINRMTANERDLRVTTSQAQQQIKLLVGANIFQQQQQHLKLSFAWEQGTLLLNQQIKPLQQVLPVLSVVVAQLMGEV